MAEIRFRLRETLPYAVGDDITADIKDVDLEPYGAVIRRRGNRSTLIIPWGLVIWAEQTDDVNV